MGALGHHRRVDLNWEAVPGATSYRVYRIGSPPTAAGPTPDTSLDGPPLAVVPALATPDLRVTYSDDTGEGSDGATYRYTIQAVAGALESGYSDIVSAIPTPDLARGGVASASSTSDAGHQAANAFAGPGSAGWRSDGATAYGAQWLEDDFAGGSQSFNRVVVAEEGHGTAGFRVEYWDGAAWRTAYSGTTLGDPARPREITFPRVRGSAVRLAFTDGTGAPCIRSFEVYLE